MWQKRIVEGQAVGFQRPSGVVRSRSEERQELWITESILATVAVASSPTAATLTICITTHRSRSPCLRSLTGFPHGFRVILVADLGLWRTIQWPLWHTTISRFRSMSKTTMIIKLMMIGKRGWIAPVSSAACINGCPVGVFPLGRCLCLLMWTAAMWRRSCKTTR